MALFREIQEYIAQDANNIAQSKKISSHRQRGHLETAPPFTVPCEGREAR